MLHRNTWLCVYANIVEGKEEVCPGSRPLGWGWTEQQRQSIHPALCSPGALLCNDSLAAQPPSILPPTRHASTPLHLAHFKTSHSLSSSLQDLRRLFFLLPEHSLSSYNSKNNISCDLWPLPDFSHGLAMELYCLVLLSGLWPGSCTRAFNLVSCLAASSSTSSAHHTRPWHKLARSSSSLCTVQCSLFERRWASDLFSVSFTSDLNTPLPWASALALWISVPSLPSECLRFLIVCVLPPCP